MSDESAPPPPGPGLTRPLGPGDFDRSWNDPPLFSYSDSANSQQAAKPRGLLNKRVAFNNNYQSVTAVGNKTAEGGETFTSKLHDAGARPIMAMLPPPPMGGPPPPMGGPPPPMGGPPPSTTGGPPSISAPVVGATPPPPSVSQHEDFCQVVTDLLQLLEENISDKRRLVEMTRRVSALSTSQVSDRVAGLVTSVVTGLGGGDWARADRDLVTLSADHAGECSGWIIAIRHLVTAVREKQLLEAHDESTAVTEPLAAVTEPLAAVTEPLAAVTEPLAAVSLESN